MRHCGVWPTHAGSGCRTCPPTVLVQAAGPRRKKRPPCPVRPVLSTACLLVLVCLGWPRCKQDLGALLAKHKLETQLLQTTLSCMGDGRRTHMEQGSYQSTRQKDITTRINWTPAIDDCMQAADGSCVLQANRLPPVVLRSYPLLLRRS